MDGWCVLFLRSDSPGKVFRFLQRRFARTAEEQARLDALGLLLSDADPPHGWRALIGGEAARPWMESVGPALLEVFPPITYLFEARADGWTYTAWAEGSVTERGGNTGAERPRGLLSWLMRPANGPSVEAMEVALSRHLPLYRVPSLAWRRRSPPILDYATVAGLDARGLLVEDSPRLYRFSFTAPAAA